ncbi:MAG TPA: DNA-3-methyladenine glycosylase [Actinomycetota bacterium]|nr:DNA-3-methyladenine glycosylase [Actinomycetota bacterium]
MATVEAQEVPSKGEALTPRKLLRPMPRSFYARPATVVARDLLGRLLVRPLPDGTLVGRIVEAGAYQEDDPASHSFRGLTPRTEVMFGPPGHLYVYFTYGMHFCMNVVTGRDGEGSAVLLRAVEPVEGIELMRKHRAVRDDRLLCSGPGRLTQAFLIGRAQNGIDLVKGEEMFVSAGEPMLRSQVGQGPRIGIRAATDRPWRLFENGSPFVSRARSSGTPTMRTASRREADVGRNADGDRAPERFDTST